MEPLVKAFHGRVLENRDEVYFWYKSRLPVSLLSQDSDT
jgi:hypothetical protein